MSKKGAVTTYDGLMELAKEYHVENNAMFIAAAQQYQTQTQVINMIRDQLNNDGSAVSTKEYVKGRENVYANPLIKELPRHTDAANKTLLAMLEIITKLGKKQEKETALGAFGKEFS